MEIGDKDDSFIGSREWIGAIELSFVLDKLLGVSSYFGYENIVMQNFCIITFVKAGILIEVQTLIPSKYRKMIIIDYLA